MIRRTLASLLLFASTCLAQATFTPGQPAAAAIPAKLVATAGSGNTCSLSGDTFPATKITFSCVVAGITIQPFTVPFPTGSGLFAVTWQVNSGSTAQTIMLSLTPGSSGVAVQATVNSQPAVTGTF